MERIEAELGLNKHSNVRLLKCLRCLPYPPSSTCHSYLVSQSSCLPSFVSAVGHQGGQTREVLLRLAHTGRLDAVPT